MEKPPCLFHRHPADRAGLPGLQEQATHLPGDEPQLGVRVTRVADPRTGEPLVVRLADQADRDRRPRPRRAAEAGGGRGTTRWMSAMDTFTGTKAAALGFLLSAVNPKNLLMCVAAGVAIGSGGLSSGDKAAAVAVFTVLAASTVAVPVLAYAVARRRLHGPLDEPTTPR